MPIRGFPNTGNLFGAGEAVEVEYDIAGSDYGGFPPPLIDFDLHLPAGVKLDAGGFPTCPLPTLEPPGMGPKLCAGAKAGPTGTVDGYVAFGARSRSLRLRRSNLSTGLAIGSSSSYSAMNPCRSKSFR